MSLLEKAGSKTVILQFNEDAILKMAIKKSDPDIEVALLFFF